MNPVEEFVSAELFHADPWYDSNKTKTYLEKLVVMCPKKFLGGNEWTQLANKLKYNCCWTYNWQWASKNQDAQCIQLFSYVLPLIRCRPYRILTDKEYMALAGWMLSVMLKEVPEFISYSDIL